MATKKNNWHSYSINDVLKEISTSKEGLSTIKAQARLKKYGPNELPKEKQLTRLQVLISQFKSPLIYILLAATAVSFFVEEFVDAAVILAAVVLNTTVGFIQENKANRAITQLRELIKKKALVLRDGAEIEIDASNLVPGDIIFIEEGDKIAADGRLISVNNFKVNEASLTGESLPISKHLNKLAKGTVVADRKNMVYMGTVCTRGRAQAIVTNTGRTTHLGEIAALLKEVPEEKTPLQEQISVFSQWIGLVVLVLAALILFIGIYQDKPFYEMLNVSAAVAVASIPEGLLVALTVLLAIGMQKILKKKALVRKLIAAETLGSVSVICTDKTGTLTLGEMQVAHISTATEEFSVPFKQAKHKESDGHMLALRIGLLANNAIIENPKAELSEWTVLGDSTERALLLAAIHAGYDQKILNNQNPRLDEIPFESEKKYMATLHRVKGDRMIYMKGAPEILLERSSYIDIKGQRKELSKKQLNDLRKLYERFTNQGLRVLAVGYRKIKPDANFDDQILSNMVFVGFIGLKDPLRKEAKGAIQLAKKAGIRPVIITGDHKLTAKTIAVELGMKVQANNIIEGEKLDKMTDDDLKKIVKKIDIYARVNPRHKLRIIDAWQALGETVAMTGDGVNDAPALKSADIGVALGSGTDVAKESSDMVLLDNNFNTIVAAVEQGRVIFENMRKVIVYLLADSFSEVILISGALILGLPLPITAAQILWVNLVADGLPSFSLTYEPGEKEVMDDKPRPRRTPLLDAELKTLIFIIGIITDFVLLAVFYFLLQQTTDLSFVRTFIFVVLGIDSLLYIFSVRSFRRSIVQTNPFRNNFLTVSVAIGFVVMAAAIYVPFFQKVLHTTSLSLYHWGIILLLASIKVMAIEITKAYFVNRRRPA